MSDSHPSRKFEAETSVDRIIARLASSSPAVPALIDASAAVSYGELDRRSDVLAGILAARGAGTDVPIGVHLERSIDFVVALLAVLKSGGCYVPLDPAYPLERLKFIVGDTGCPLVLSRSGHPALGAAGARIDLDRFDWSAAAPSPPGPASPAALAYILYTSGSTGTPKGVEIEHRNLLHLVRWHHATFPEEARYTATQAASPGFDAAGWEIWSHLTRGGTIRFIPDELLLQPRLLAPWLQKYEVSECFLPTPVAEMMLDCRWEGPVKLKYLHSGGDRLTRKAPKDFPAVLTNLYGPTECTVIATWAEFAPGGDDGQMPDIGRPVDRCEVRIVDPGLRELPDGAEGEIVISGAGVGRGYHRRPDLTASAFVPNPFAPGTRLYRTGDLGIRRQDGRIDFVGRRDFQVKIRGFRIELGEIEAVIGRHPDVAKAVVIDRKSAAGGKFLAAYVTVRRENPALVEELRALIREHLPEYMMPSAVTVLNEMPLSVNGKIDRRALPEPELLPAGGGDAALVTPTEQQLAALWSELLKVATPGADANFFMLGGHSLLATELCLELERRLHVQLPIHAVFEHPVLRELAARIDRAALPAVSGPPPLRRHPRAGGRYPLSAEQRGMWMMERTGGIGNLFNIPLVITLRGPADDAVLEAALGEVLARHEIFRAGFDFAADRLAQFPAPPAAFRLERRSLAALKPKEREAAWHALLDTQRQIVFDLSSPPLFRALLVEYADGDRKLLFTIHHLIFDGWSSTIFFRELGEAYRRLVSGEPAAPPSAAEPDYLDFVLWQQEYLDGGAAARELDYWRGRLDGMNPPPSLPFADPSRPRGGRRGRRCYLTVPAELTGRLTRLASGRRATLFMVLNAALQTLLYRYTGAADMTTATSIANRNHAGLVGIVGLFINSLPLRTRFSGSLSFSELLDRVVAGTLEAYAHQDLPFDELLAEVKRRNPVDAVFNVSLLLQNLPYDAMTFCGVEMSFEEVGNDTAKIDLMITFEERDGGLSGWFEYDAEQFSSEVIAETADAYAGLLRQIADDPARAVWAYDCPLPAAAAALQSCYIVGETALTPQCVRILHDHGIRVLGVFSPDETVRRQVRRLGVPAYEADRERMREIMAIRPFDDLFSIVNGMVFDAGLLALPRRFAVNYHDGPLPAYAGMHAPAWALLNGEKTHGVTWHVMTGELDAGPILTQREIPLEAEETAASLHLKCAEAALASFRQLAGDLSAGTVRTRPQNPAGRSWFGRFQRPDRAGLIDWTCDAATVAQRVRALDFGGYDNPFGVAKLAAGHDFLVVTEATAFEHSNPDPAGTVLDVAAGRATIAAGSGAVRLGAWKKMDGTPVDPEEIGLAAGDRLPAFPDEALRRLTADYGRAARHEAALVRQLRSRKLPESPLFGEAAELIERELPPVGAPEYPVSALFAVYLARLIDQDEFDLGVALPPPDGPACFAPLYAAEAPCRIQVNFDAPWEENVRAAADALAATVRRGPGFADLACRFRGAAAVFNCVVAPAGVRPILRLPRDAAFELMLRRFEIFYANAFAAAGRPLGALALISEAERELMLYGWNATRRDFNLNRTYAEAFAERVAAAPAAVAVKCGDETLTYHELDRRADRIACLLPEHGVAGNAVIGVCMGRSLELAAALLGVFKAGCAYLPLDPAYPASRLETMIRDARIGLMLTDDRGAAAVRPPDGVAAVNLCRDRVGEPAAAGVMPPVDRRPGDLAYLMYTSGSTGVPKGVMITQSNLLNHNLGVIGDYELSAADRVLQCGSISFDLSVEEIFPCWLAGATLVFRPDGPLEAPDRLCEFIAANRITVLDLPTAYWRELAGRLGPLRLPASVRLVVIGGEAASPEHFEKWRAHAGGVRLINSYGPTECTVISTWSEEAASIGRPVANARCYILNRRLQPQPPGVPGELYIGGAGVADGYWGRPEQTAAAFLADPFVPGGRIYRTGDLASFAADGRIVFAGRVDDQIKLRGFRIEPGDIESRLKRQPAVADALVVVRENGRGDRMLVAYLLAAPGGRIDISRLRDELKKTLPDYLIPAAFVPMDAFPLTPNGKIDRRALPPPDCAGRAVPESKPGSSLEMQLRLIFRKLLGMDAIDPDAGFFELGGDSLKAIRLLLEIERATGCRVPMDVFFTEATVRSLSRHIAAERFRHAAWSALVPLNEPESGDKTPLFLLHTTPGDILGYVNLIKLLDDRPIYGIQSPGLNRIELARRDLGTMAADYVKLMREKQPAGPYFLGGWCFGGFLALEMARRLTADGEKVGFLGLIETWGQPPFGFRFCCDRLVQLLRWGPRNWPGYIRYKLSGLVGARRGELGLDFLADHTETSGGATAVDDLKRLYRINLAAFDRYDMKPYAGEIELFQSLQPPPGVIPDRWYDWKRLAPRLVIHRFDGGHGEILKEPYVRPLAAKFVERMTAAEARK